MINLRSETTDEGPKMSVKEIPPPAVEQETVAIIAEVTEKKKYEGTEKERVKEQFSKFLEIFRKVNINIPLVEALQKMPLYAKFLKEIVSRKNKLGKFETRFGKALCDLGASINLMPLSIFKRLAIGVLKPTSMMLQMADRSVTYPRRIVEDVLVKDGNKIPLILGRSFLATGRALIDVEKRELTLRVKDESQKFSVYRPCRIHEDEVPKKVKGPGKDPAELKFWGRDMAGKDGAERRSTACTSLLEEIIFSSSY
ncbi:uncharacterized protein LOC131009744 [Salvia miltiorrhiza]|uniref:uncharacterized protein LOC131009744 n=1 Tax=Salvia miltiorrhiza TaxID=226208 RepID=UPI0025ACC379|nr:uncharacterized protein LOC131009744 [Salvia miltiorrhiza]